MQILGHESVWNWGGPCEDPGLETFLCPPFLVCREQTPTSMSVLECQWTNQGREGMQKQGRSSQETAVQIWGRVLAQPQGIHRTISSEFFMKPPINGSCRHSSFQRRLPKAQLKEPEKLIKRSLENRSKYRHCTHPNLISNPSLELLLWNSLPNLPT